jgi:hypothetical protein
VAGSGAPGVGSGRATSSFVPQRITIPAIGIDSTVRPVTVGAGGALGVPPRPDVLGWWRDGARPASGRGTVVMDGHLDSRHYGRGPLARLGELELGDRAVVTGAAGQRQVYLVTAVRVYAKSRLPYRQVFDQGVPERLVLVTCGGRYLRDRGGWDSNVVVFLDPA